ncbi:ABC transporter permease subunit [Acidilobus sp. 7A]|uniref:ABC transporter permease subunit n=1 Tax=Acidilobus sp. 7A TaxID=1577685 RepID=UPI000764DDD8|nr:ABC transporter permease subunit [Acidilobus sp. 7A]AMD30361.1 ABC transporter permease [Acidilobus sp. 7A]
MRLDEVRTILWKELLDIARDRRALALMIIVPLVGLPLLALLAGGLSSAQVTSVYIQVNDTKSMGIAKWLGENLVNQSEQQGLRVNVTISSRPPPQVYDIEVMFPQGFYSNLTSLDGVATLIVRVMVGSYAAQEVDNLIAGIVSGLSSQVVNSRVESLARLANVTISPQALLNPISITTGYILPSGQAASVQQVQLSFTVRLLQFSLFFVVNPAVVLVTDAFLGEKERKTLEVLLASPASGTSMLVGKLLSSAVMGLAIAIADSAGFIIYFLMLASSAGLKLTPSLLALNLADSAVLVLMTSSFIMPIVLRSPSARAAQASSYALLMVALGIYFSALFVNIGSLPAALRYAIMAIPFTEASLALSSYVLGQYALAVVDILIMLLFTTVFTLISVKVFNAEKLVTSR